MLAYPDIAIGHGVTFGAGVVLRAYDGGSIVLRGDSLVGRGVSLIAAGGRIEIGVRGFVGQGSIIAAVTGISIGDDSLIAEGVTIRDQDHPLNAAPRNREPAHAVPIAIGDNVWIGAKASVLKGVTIGDDVVVGAHAVVTRDVPAKAVALGIPATVRHHIHHR